MYRFTFSIVLLVCFTAIFAFSTADAAEDWTLKSPSTSPTTRCNQGMAYISDDQILLFGGERGANNYVDDTWLYTLSTNTWTDQEDGLTWVTGTSKPSVRFNHFLAYIGDDKVMLFGGSNTGGYLNDTWIYDLSDNSWTNMNPAGDKPSTRTLFGMAYIEGDQVLLYGGYMGAVYEDTWVYDLSENSWTDMNPSGGTPLSRSHHSM